MICDNAQYWLAECYYSQKDYKRAIIEFEKVFTVNTNKNDDAQYKIALAHQSIGSIKKLVQNFSALLNTFQSEFISKLKPL